MGSAQVVWRNPSIFRFGNPMGHFAQFWTVWTRRLSKISTQLTNQKITKAAAALGVNQPDLTRCVFLPYPLRESAEIGPRKR